MKGTNYIIGIFLLLVISCNHKNNQVQNNMKDKAIVRQEFIYSINEALTPQCHASTIAESNGNLIAAWFGGTEEKNIDVGIWVSIHSNKTWSNPEEVVNGVQADGSRYPCWNPVLFQPKEGSLMLFYKIGPNPREWWGMLITSEDGGEVWSEPMKLPDGILGPIKNKPVQLSDGTILSPTSTEHDGWEIQLERSADLGKSWSNSGSLNDGKEIGAIQPTILIYQDRRMQLLSRTENGYISECWSEDGGLTWGEMRLTSLLNPNSGIDAVTLNDWRQLLVFNPTGGDWGARVPLSLAVSKDGISWKQLFDLEPVTNPDTADDEEYSYPGVIQSTDGLVHVVYTWNRKTVKHVVIDPKKLEL